MANGSMPILHVMFSLSAAGSLRKALAETARSDEVVALPDDLSFGPLNPISADFRARWVETELDYDWPSWETDLSAQINAFWTRALSPEYRLIGWTSGRCASDHCGFLEWLWRLGERSCEVIDLTDIRLDEFQLQDGRSVPPRLAVSTGSVPHQQIISVNLFDLTTPQSAPERASCHHKWGRLRHENAALRVVADGELASAPLSFFDSTLLAHTKPNWLKAARVVGEVLGDHWRQGISPVGDLVLWARLRALADAGRVEYRGDLTRMQSTEVRLAGQ
jgi:hypothetical protein